MKEMVWPKKYVRVRPTYHMNGTRMIALEWKVGILGTWLLEGLYDPTDESSMKNLERRKLRLEDKEPTK